MINIAIDGPSGAGKSTVARILAQRLGIAYLDTGAMYRALGLKALKLGIDPADEPAVSGMLSDTKVDVALHEGGQRVFLDGRDVTEDIREHRVSKTASDISALPVVRKKMAELQRQIAAKSSCVLDGREIGSFVLPGADYKFFLTASAGVRAARRTKELAEKGQHLAYEEVLRDIESRDQRDAGRAFAPLKCVSDAVVVDSSELTAAEVVDKFLNVIGESNNG